MQTLRAIAVFFLGVVVAAWIGGCSKTANPGAAAGSGNSGSQSSSSANNRSPSQGSLEDLRRGQSPATPGDSALREIYFDFDSYTLRADARETLKADAEWLKRNPGVRITVEGHCDERGTTEYNLALGAKRAQAARDYLISLGLPAERISTTSFGSEAPVCRDHTDECWQRNRRDRFVAQAGRAGA